MQVRITLTNYAERDGLEGAGFQIMAGGFEVWSNLYQGFNGTYLTYRK